MIYTDFFIEVFYHCIDQNMKSYRLPAVKGEL